MWNNLAAMPRLAVLLAAVCFGTTGTAQALGPDGLEPTAVGAARIAVGGLLLVVAARALAGGGRGSPARARAGAGSGRGAILAAALGVALYQLAFFAAVDRTGVVVGTLVAIGSGPALAGLLDRAVRGTALTGRWAGATALAAAGVALLALAGGDTATIDPLGVLLAVVAGAAYATYTVAAKALLDAGRAPESVMAAAFGLAALALLPVLVLAGAGWLVTPGGAALALYLGIVPTALAYVLFARGLRRLPAAETATLTLAEPLTAALLGALVLGERLGPLAAAGALLVLGGLLVLALPGPGRRPVRLEPAR